MTTVLRSLRTWCATGCASAIRTREAGAPSDSAASIDDRRDRALGVGGDRVGDAVRGDVAEVEQERQRIGPRRDVRHRLGRLDDERRALAR